jgi:hypothetical protein
MAAQTIMEKADAILANMGISDTVPLSEASSDSINAVGKDYSNQELPDVNDEQRNQLLAHAGFLTEAKEEEEVEDENADPVGDVEEKPEEKPEEEPEEEPKAKKKRKKTYIDIDKSLTLTKRKRSRREGRGARTAKNAKEAKVVGETTVGMVGVGPLGNSPAPDPDKPYGNKKGKKKKRRSTLKFIDLAFNK